ncbi:DUF3592 domain-containing protein [Streptomonospora wellingtoniae]|uniref:DUF3592 domain-containing protein n=1 Tax=Streptomonospora wellingtoniae TaxID=3075544 RepID=A0ABU2KUV9_9ACTN|nr:DUF3592 domain-containing protein [Streptomonospora sp. DSM 45055]MDT0303069.1 DUF3592 domain-containing protein [Streptomonospora sp. DSM 45055]
MKRYSGTPGSSDGGARRGIAVVLAVLCGIFALVFLIIGGIFTLIAQADYSAHTGRAEAVVSEVEVERDDIGTDDNDDNDVDITVYVDYRAEGGEYNRVPLSGLNPDDHAEGERLTVAYDPADPGNPVTVESTEEGAFDVFLWLGIGMLAAGGLAGLVGLVLVVVAARG